MDSSKDKDNPVTPVTVTATPDPGRRQFLGTAAAATLAASGLVVPRTAHAEREQWLELDG